jgi:hypothetical protein
LAEGIGVQPDVMTIHIHQIALSRAQLATLPEAERNLFVLLGHSANEVSALAKLFHYCAGNRPTEPILEKAHNSQALLMGRLLTGKIYEFWIMLRAGYFGSALSRTYDQLLEADARNALGEMGRYFGADNLIERVRNGHAFHYDVSQIQQGFAAVVDGDPLDIYLAEANANSLYAFADTIAGRAMLESIRPQDPATAFSLLISETSRAVGWVNIVVAGLMMTCLRRHLGNNLYALGANEINIEGAPNSQEVTIPFFIEIAVRETA